MTTLTRQAINLGLLCAVLGSIMFIGFEVGLEQSWEVVSSDDTNVTADTYGALGQDPAGSPEVTFIDRLVVIAMATTALTALGVLGISRSNPEILNTFLRYYPLLGLVIGVTSFGDECMDIITQDFDWDANPDGYGAMILAIFGWVVSGLGNLMNNR